MRFPAGKLFRKGLRELREFKSMPGAPAASLNHEAALRTELVLREVDPDVSESANAALA